MKKSFQIVKIATQLQRRDFLKWSSGLAIALGLPTWITAAPNDADGNLPVSDKPPLPIVDARFPCRIADGIWLIPDKRINLVPNIGIVEGDAAVLVIDCGINGEDGRNVLETVRTIAGKRKIILTVTHAHPEHTFGAQAFKGEAKIFYNKLQRDYLARNGEKLLKGFHQVLPPDQVYLLKDINITLADEVYSENQASIDLGNRKVIFQTWGTAHSPGDQVITIPDQKVTFAGDLIEERIFPIVPFFPPMIERSDINLHNWEVALSHIVSEQPRIVVPGHGNLGGVEIVTQVLDYFKDIRKLVAPFKGKKTSEVDIVKELEPIIRSHNPTWEGKEFIAPALRYLAGLS